MSEHAFGSSAVDEGGGRVSRCACGAVLRASTLDDLALAIGIHLLEVGEAPICRECGGELVDWSSTRDYVEADDGLCGRCRLDRGGPCELGRRRL